jgi:hypothetical protein
MALGLTRALEHVIAAVFARSVGRSIGLMRVPLRESVAQPDHLLSEVTKVRRPGRSRKLMSRQCRMLYVWATRPR